MIATGLALDRSQHVEHFRELVAVLFLAIGVLLAWTRTPNKEAQVFDDGDLAIFSVAFLGMGALLPLLRAVTASHRVWGYALLGFFYGSLLALVAWRLVLKCRAKCSACETTSNDRDATTLQEAGATTERLGQPEQATSALGSGPGDSEPPASGDGGCRKTDGKMPPHFFVIAFAYLIILIVIFILYQKEAGFRILFPSMIGPLPVEVAWFGAVGGALISLSGTFGHACDWDPRWRYWHYSRPVVAGVIGSLGCLLFYVLLKMGNGGTTKIDNTVFDAVAFLLGYGEGQFRALITKLTGLLFGPGPADGASVDRRAH